LCAITNPCLFFHELNAYYFFLPLAAFFAALFLAFDLVFDLGLDLPLADFAGAASPSAAGFAFLGLRAGSSGGKGLAMSVNLLVLFFAFEVEDQDLVCLAAFHDLSADHCACAGTDSALLAGHGQNVIEFNGVAVGGRQLLNFHYVAGCDAVLLSPGANYRVHNSLHRPFKALGRKGLILTCKIAQQPCSTGRNFHQWQTL
jgi:hypothetical protein